VAPAAPVGEDADPVVRVDAGVVPAVPAGVDADLEAPADVGGLIRPRTCMRT
jgi:hypothetical protein